MLVGAAAWEDELEALPAEAVELEPPEVAEAVPDDDAVAEGVALYLAGSRVPQLSWMLVVQFSWPLALPTLASLQSWNACWQMNCSTGH